MSGNQLSLFKDFNSNEIQSYLTSIRTARSDYNGIFDHDAAQSYARAINGLEGSQAALLLSTQGLTNAQIAETLAVNESSVAKNYQAMVDAGLLARKKSLTVAEIQRNLQSILGAEADTSAAMASLGLSAATENQEHHIVQLTSKKLYEAASTHVLTEAQAQELAMRTGVSLSMQNQAAGVLPKWIATIKAATIAIWDQVKATAVWLATTPAGWVTSAVLAIGTVVALAVKANNAAKESVIEANEAMADAVSAYDSAKSSLENINSELEEQKQKMDELLAKDKLTYAEKGKLAELQAITKELELQQSIEEKLTEKAAREAAEKAVTAYDKQYGDYDISKDDLLKKLDYTEQSGFFPLSDGADDITANIAGYIKATELLDKAKLDYERALKNGEDASLFEDDIQDYSNMVNDFSYALNDSVSDLQEKRLALFDAYNIAIDNRENGAEPLTEKERDNILTYEAIHDAMRLIYEYTDQNAWNEMEISGIFNTAGIEKTKDELTEMAKAGELTPETIAGYKKLNTAIEESELFCREGQTAAEAFCDEINAYAKTAAYLPAGFTGFAESESKAIDGFQAKAKTLGDALSSIKSGNTSGITDLVQEFPELAGQTDNLEQAVTDLINDSLAELYNTLGKNLPDNIKDDLQSIADEATGAVPRLDEAFSAIRKSSDVMQEFKDAMDTGRLTDSVLSNAGSLSSYMNEMAAGYHAGAVSADQLYNALI